MTRSPELLDLERDLPTTPEDVAAQRRVGQLRAQEPFAALQELFDSLPPAARRPRRTTAAGRTEFEL